MLLRTIALGLVAGGIALPLRAGPLNPPAGPVAPTSRTVIQTVPIVINQPGSYVLTSNLLGPPGVDAITITVDGVTIDMNGFSLIGLPGSFDGITSPAPIRDLTVINGSIEGFGGDGISGPNISHSKFTNLHARNNLFSGFTSSASNVFTWCTAEGNGAQGFEDFAGACVYENCTSQNNAAGFVTSTSAVLRGCAAKTNAIAGFTSGAASVMIGCSAEANGTDGFYLGNGSLASQCVAISNQFGFRTGDDTRITLSVAFANPGAGIFTEFNNNLYENNHVLANGKGIWVGLPGRLNAVRDNIVRQNTDNYDFTADNMLDLLIAEIPESLDWPCAARLAGDLRPIGPGNGLTITTSEVVIDLAGHALIGSGPAGLVYTGIVANAPITTPTGIKVFGGTVREWGVHGVDLSNTQGSLLERVACLENGANGAIIGRAGAVHACTFNTNGSNGIDVFGGTVVQHSTASANIGAGIAIIDGSLAVACTSRDNQLDGFALIDGSIVDSCVSMFNGNFGYFVDLGSRLTRSTARFNQGNGIEVLNECDIQDNTVTNNGSAQPTLGINVVGLFNRIRGNDVKNHTVNFNIAGLRNTIYENAAANGAPDYAVVPGNDLAPVTPAAAAIPRSNITY